MGNLGVWCRLSHDAARHHIYRLVRTAGSFGSGSPKKESLGRKSSSGVLYFLFFFCAPRGMSCNASPVHDGFLFSRGLLCFSNYRFYLWYIFHLESIQKRPEKVQLHDAGRSLW